MLLLYVLFGVSVVLRTVPYTLGERDQQGTFWQITDIHWDQQYSVNGNPALMCHDTNTSRAHNSIYGNYNCDSPWLLVKSSIQAMAEINDKPDFVLWTGDNVPHTDDPEPDFSVIFRSLSNITGELRTAFQASIPILPVLGNHDAFPKDDYPVAGEEFYGKYLSQGGWAALLPQEAQQDFKRGGYYGYSIASGVTVLVVNTNLYYAFNTLGVNASDPCGQFAWMRSKLQAAREESSKVIVTAHAPPGYFERLAVTPFFNATYNKAYATLLNDFGDVILAQIYGHEHTDSFRLFSDAKGNIQSVAFLAPSVTPWHAAVVGGTAINPSVRLYLYNHSEILDYAQYHVNLTKLMAPVLEKTLYLTSTTSVPQESAEVVKPKWELFYQARETYNLSSLNTVNLAKLYNQLENDDALFQKYYFRNSAGYYNGLCDSNCKKNHLCAIAYIGIKDVEACMIPNQTKPDSLFPNSVTGVGETTPGKHTLASSSRSHYIIVFVVLSMTLTVVLAVILAVMLAMIVIKRRKMVPTQRSFPILDLARNHKRNYRQLP